MRKATPPKIRTTLNTCHSESKSLYCMQYVRRVHPAGTAGAILPPYSTRIPTGLYACICIHGALGTRYAGTFYCWAQRFHLLPRESREAGVRCLQPPLHYLYAAPAFQLRYESEEEIGTRRRCTSSSFPFLHNNRTHHTTAARAPIGIHGKIRHGRLPHSRRTHHVLSHPSMKIPPSPGRIGRLASHPMRYGYRRGPAAGRCGCGERGRGMDGPCVNKCGGGTWAGGRRRGLARARAVSGSWAGSGGRASPSARCRRASLGGVSRSGTRVRTKRARPHLSPAGARHLADVWARTPLALSGLSLSPVAACVVWT